MDGVGKRLLHWRLSSQGVWFGVSEDQGIVMRKMALEGPVGFEIAA